MNKMRVVAAVLVMLGIVVGYVVFNSSPQNHRYYVILQDKVNVEDTLTGFIETLDINPSLIAKFGYMGLICPIVTRANGEVEVYPCVHNLITNGGLDMIKVNMMGTGERNVLNKIVLGNNASPLVVTDVELSGKYVDSGLDMKTGYLVDVATGNWSISYEWTATDDNNPVNCTGVYNTTTANNLFAEGTFPTVTLNTGDKLNITYYQAVVRPT